VLEEVEGVVQPLSSSEPAAVAPAVYRKDRLENLDICNFLLTTIVFGITKQAGKITLSPKTL
jgi:hypothetical protein